MSDTEIEERFAVRILSGLRAFAHDMTYFVEMAETGSRIHYKRELYAARKEAEEEEARAQRVCEATAKSAPFLCASKSACGFGRCLFAQEFKGIRATGDGDRQRPASVAARQPTYSLEPAVAEMLDRRGVRSTRKR